MRARKVEASSRAAAAQAPWCGEAAADAAAHLGAMDSEAHPVPTTPHERMHVRADSFDMVDQLHGVVPHQDDADTNTGDVADWKTYYQRRLQEHRTNLLSAANSLLFNFHLSRFPDSEQDRFMLAGTVRKSAACESSPAMAAVLRREAPYFCHIHHSLYYSPDHPSAFTWARRFLIFQLFTQIEIAEDTTIPAVRHVETTAHPCIVKVTVDATMPGVVLSRRTYICFTETMEVIDGLVESVVDLGYRQLLECDSKANPKPAVAGMPYAKFLDRLLRKTPTILRNYPHGIAREVYAYPAKFQLAQRYLFCNAKCVIRPAA
nr:hypothetical protein HK105_000655 [Polyrhizophydium stewartii]